MKYRKCILFFTILLLMALVSLPVQAQESQAGTAEQQPAGQGEQAGFASQMDPLDENMAAAPVDPKSFVIGAEDRLLIRVWREPEVSGAVIVRPDGMITLPLIGDVQASGRTPNKMREEISGKLSEFLTRPEVMVSVSAIRSKKYYLTGQINRTGSVPLVVPTTVLEALSGAGGFQQWANRKKIMILRGTERFKFNYIEVIKGKNLQQNIYLQNGDHIIVP